MSSDIIEHTNTKIDEQIVFAHDTTTNNNNNNKVILDCDELVNENKIELMNKQVNLVKEITNKEATVVNKGKGQCDVAKDNNLKICEDTIPRGFKRQIDKEELIKGIFFKETMEIEEGDEEKMQNTSCSSNVKSGKEEKLTLQEQQQIIVENDKNKVNLKRKKIIESDDEDDEESYNEDTDKTLNSKKRKLNGNNLLSVLGLTQWNAQTETKHEVTASNNQTNMNKQDTGKQKKSGSQKDNIKEYPSEGKAKQGQKEKENVLHNNLESVKGSQVQKQTKGETTGGSEEEMIQNPKPKRKYQQRKKPTAKPVDEASKEEQEFMQNILEFLEDDKSQPKKKTQTNSRKRNDNTFIDKIEQKVKADATLLEQEKLKKAILEQQEVILKQKMAVEEQQRQLQIQIQLRAEKQQRFEQEQKQKALLQKSRVKQEFIVEEKLQEQESKEEEKVTQKGKQEQENEKLDNKEVNQNQQVYGKVEEQAPIITNNPLDDQDSVQQQQQVIAAVDSEVPVIGNVKNEPIKDIVPLVIKQEQLQQQQQQPQHQFQFPSVLPPQLIQQQFMMMQQNMQLQAIFQQLQQNQQNPQFPFLIQPQAQQGQQQQFIQNGTFISAGIQPGGIILPNQQIPFNQQIEIENQGQFNVKNEEEQQEVCSNIGQVSVITSKQSNTKQTAPQIQPEQIKEEAIEEEEEIIEKPKKPVTKRTKKQQQPKVLEDSFDGERIVQDVPKTKTKTKAKFSTKKLNDSSPEDTVDEEYTVNVKASSKSKQNTEKSHNKQSYRESDLKLLQGKHVKTEDIPEKKKHHKQQDKTVESNSSKLVEDQKKNGNINENSGFQQNDKFLKLMQQYSKPTATTASGKENKQPVIANPSTSSQGTSKIDNFIENIQKSKLSQSSTGISSKESISQEQPENELQKVENLPKIGHFRYGDKPSEIISSRIINGIIYIEIEWKPRINQFRPSTSIVSTEEIKLFDKDFLIEYYESKILKSNSSKVQNVPAKSKMDILHKISASSVAYTTLVNNKSNNSNGIMTAGSLGQQQSKKDIENGGKDNSNNDISVKNNQNGITSSVNGQQKRKQIDLMSEKTFEEEDDEDDTENKSKAEKQQLNDEKEKDNSDSNGAFYENPYQQFMIQEGALGDYDQILAKMELIDKEKDNKKSDKQSKGKEQLNNEKSKDVDVTAVTSANVKLDQNEKKQLDLGLNNGKSLDNGEQTDKSKLIAEQTPGTKNHQNNLDTDKKEINDNNKLAETHNNISKIKEKPLINLNDQIEEEYEINMNKSY